VKLLVFVVNNPFTFFSITSYCLPITVSPILNGSVFKGHKDIDVYFSLANAHLYKGDLKRAGEYFRLIPKEQFQREDIAATYALYLIRVGDMAGAKRVMSQRNRSGVAEITAISNKIEKILSQRMKVEKKQ
jgi:hypothetical protein